MLDDPHRHASGPLKVVAVLNAAELLESPCPMASPNWPRAIAMVREHGLENVAAIVRGRLSGSQIAEAGLSVQPKGAKPAEKEAAAA